MCENTTACAVIDCVTELRMATDIGSRPLYRDKIGASSALRERRVQGRKQRRNTPEKDKRIAEREQIQTTTRKAQRNKTEPPTVFEGNNKGDLSAGPTTPSKNWSTEVTTYLLPMPRGAEITRDTGQPEDTKTTVIDDTYIDERIPEEGLHYEEGLQRAQR
eukprot:6469988-Amphidinium_carterae.6